jgi:hypothetical protein
LTRKIEITAKIANPMRLLNMITSSRRRDSA